MTCCLLKQDVLTKIAFGTLADVTTAAATKTYSDAQTIGNFERMAFVIRSSGGVPLTADELPKITVEVGDDADFSNPATNIIQVCNELDFTSLEAVAPDVPAFIQAAIEVQLAHIGTTLDGQSPNLTTEEQATYKYLRVGFLTVDASIVFEVCYMNSSPQYGYQCNEHYNDWVGQVDGEIESCKACV